MRSFYLNVPSNYYSLADQASDKYNLQEQPFHCHLAEQISQGDHVLELGCGTAHFCPQTQKRGAIYHGADLDPHLLENNRRKWTGASFFTIGEQIPDLYDMVISLYTIEHVVDPPSYLKLLWSYARPGGRIGIICPDFIDGEGIPPSVYFGYTPRRLRQKIASWSLLDAGLHLYDWLMASRAWKTHARLCPPGAFWMNLDPRDLAARSHAIDGDAVHLPRLEDLVFWFRKNGAKILHTSRTLPDIPHDIIKHNCYILAQKPL
jgi:SAM-dependent methyltransferase